MKRLLTLAAVFLCSLLTFAQFSGSGSGTESDPYLILNPIQLSQMRNYLNKSGVYFKLMTNIDVSAFIEDEWSTQGWMPIGTSSTPFKGILDGNGKTISGFWINRPTTDYVGLFANTVGATIKNLNLNSSSIKGKSHVGIISGCSNTTTIKGCIVSSSNEVTGSGNRIGGIVGFVEGVTISECRVFCNNITGVNYVGGIYGEFDTSNYNNPITACYVQGIVNGGDYIGGICGKGSRISNTIFCGNVAANSNVGGICGYTIGGPINGCYAVAHIMASGNYVGGLIGYLYNSNLTNSYLSGSVTGNEQVGGLVGYATPSTGHHYIEKCYSNTNVNGKKTVGGLIGKLEGHYYRSSYMYMSLNSNVSICSSVKATIGNVGRIYGEKDSHVTIGEIGTNNENKALNRAIIVSAGVSQDVADNEQNGTGVSATTLKLKATYVAMGWDFTNTWDIQETESYPYMKSQTAPPVILSQVISGATVVSGKCVDGGTVTLEIDGVKQQNVSTGNEFSFTVSPLQAGHEVRVSAKAEGKEQSYYTTEVVSFLGRGTESDPYQISTAADLSQVYRKGYYKLMNDIDLTNYINQFSPTEGWQSIGRDGSETIYFDGDGHKITGLWSNSSRENTGLFSCFANGYIKNLTVVTANGKQVKGINCTGILIGKMINGQVENCKVEGTVNGTTQTGGLIGLLSGGSIKSCQANINVSSSTSNAYIGGIIGELNGTIDQCLTKGAVIGTGSGINVGGVVGVVKANSSVTNSYSSAFVSSDYCAAGIAGYNYGLVEKCYASGNIFCRNYGAGVIGYNDGSNAIVRYCVAMCKKLEVVYESQQSQQGGGYGQRIIGGIKNGAPAPETEENYALKTMQVSVNDVAQTVYDDIMNGTAKTGFELMSKSTYETLTWDFTNVWKIEEGSSYPYLDMKEGGSDDPSGNPDPVVTTSDVLCVDNITTMAGKTTTVEVNLKNITTDYTGYQFDIILPADFEIAKNNKDKLDFAKGERYEDDSQQLSIEYLGENTYRVLSFSMSNGVIEGNDGAIMTFKLQASADIEEGDYIASLKDIVFTESDGTQCEMADTTFNITINNVIKGDANGDTKVNVSDIVEIVNYILGKPSERFNVIAADVSEDNTVNVTDIVRIVNMIMSTNNTSNVPRAIGHINSDITINGTDVRLDNASSYTAAQLDILLNEGQKIEDIALNITSDHVMVWQMVNDKVCRVIIYSMSNSPFESYGNNLLGISITGDSTSANIGNVVLAPADGQTTGIELTPDDNSQEVWYSIEGRRLNYKPTRKGVYILNGKKYIVK